MQMPVSKRTIFMWPIKNYIKKKTKTKSNQETNKQNKNTHTDKQSRFSYLTIPKLLSERNLTYLLTNSLGQGSAASLLTLGVLDLRPVDGSFLKRSDELRTSVALLLLSSTTAIKKNGTLLKQVGICNSVARSRCLQLVQVQFHKLCFSIFLKQEMLLGKLV